MAKQSKKYAGCLWGQNVDGAGVATGPIFKMGNTYPLALEVSVKSNEMTSALCDSHGQLLEVRNEVDSNSGEMTLYQFGANEIGSALRATPVLMTGTSGTVAATAVVAPAAGEWIETGKKNLTTFTLTDAAAVVTYVKGTDYLLNEHLGLWTPIAGGGITKDDALKWSCGYAAASGYQLDVATALQSYLRIFGSLKEIKTGNKVAVNLKCVSMVAKKGVTLISEPKTEYESLTFDLKLITPSGQTSPATIEGLTAD